MTEVVDHHWGLREGGGGGLRGWEVRDVAQGKDVGERVVAQGVEINVDEACFGMAERSSESWRSFWSQDV